jgi:predicted transcriptional regulator
LGEATVEQIVCFFPEPEQPNYKTTHTLLRIMETKGFITHSTSGKVFVFKPLISEAEIAKASVNNLLKQSFGGSARGLFINLLESGNIKESELREIEALVRKHRKSEEGGAVFWSGYCRTWQSRRRSQHFSEPAPLYSLIVSLVVYWVLAKAGLEPPRVSTIIEQDRVLP